MLDATPLELDNARGRGGYKYGGPLDLTQAMSQCGLRKASDRSETWARALPGSYVDCCHALE
jgi:hypothetical protein